MAKEEEKEGTEETPAFTDEQYTAFSGMMTRFLEENRPAPDKTQKPAPGVFNLLFGG